MLARTFSIAETRAFTIRSETRISFPVNARHNKGKYHTLCTLLKEKIRKSLFLRKTNYFSIYKIMNTKEELIKEIDRIPEPLLSQLLDFALFIKARYLENDLSEEEKANITAAKLDYQAGDYVTLEEYEASER